MSDIVAGLEDCALPTCPNCSTAHSDVEEERVTNGCIAEFKCRVCKTTFEVISNVEITYSTLEPEGEGK